jgi:xylulokinase
MLQPDAVAQDPAEWISGVKNALRSALEQCDRQRIAGISVSGQQHGLVALDADHKVLLRPAEAAAVVGRA